MMYLGRIGKAVSEVVFKVSDKIYAGIITLIVSDAPRTFIKIFTGIKVYINAGTTYHDHVTYSTSFNLLAPTRQVLDGITHSTSFTIWTNQSECTDKMNHNFYLTINQE